MLICKESQYHHCSFFTECPWTTSTEKNDTFLCINGEECEMESNGTNKHCCEHLGGREKCPGNWPIMCANPMVLRNETKNETEYKDYLCGEVIDNCEKENRGGPRECSKY